MCVCVCEEDAVSSHQHTSLDTWDRGTLTLRLPSCSEGPPGLRTAHVPLREPRSWMTRKYLAVFLGVLFLLRWCSEVERVLCTDSCTLCYLKNVHLYFALKKSIKVNGVNMKEFSLLILFFPVSLEMSVNLIKDALAGKYQYIFLFFLFFFPLLCCILYTVQSVKASRSSLCRVASLKIGCFKDF